MEGIGLSLALTAVFIAINGFFVAAEFALVKARQSRIKTLADKGNRRAKLAAHILAHLDLYLSGCQLGITAASLVLGYLAEPAVAQLLTLAVHGLGLQLGESVLHPLSLAFALTAVTMLHMIFGEQAPKIWAIHTAEKTVLAIAWPLRLFVTALRPLIWAVNQLSNLVLRLTGIKEGLDEEATHDVAELRAIVARSAEAGFLTVRQGEFTQNLLSLVVLEVRHILVPRVDVAVLYLGDPLEENLKVIRRSGHSRFPLCRDDLDSVVGIVHAKDVLSALLDGPAIDLEKLARPVAFVPEIQPLSRMIVELQASHSGCAVVIDEHGTALGVVYLEDALEEIVGPIEDEFDQTARPYVQNPEPGVFLIAGDLPLPEALEVLGLEAVDDADTIGGYVVSQLKRLPRAGDTIDLGQYDVKVEEVSRRRVTLLRFVNAHPVQGEAPTEEE